MKCFGVRLVSVCVSVSAFQDLMLEQVVCIYKQKSACFGMVRCETTTMMSILASKRTRERSNVCVFARVSERVRYFAATAFAAANVKFIVYAPLCCSRSLMTFIPNRTHTRTTVYSLFGMVWCACVRFACMLDWHYFLIHLVRHF